MTLLEYFERSFNRSTLFNPGEFSEITKVVYIILRRAVIAGSDILIIKPTEFIWTKDEQILGQAPIWELKSSSSRSFHDHLRLILERDEVIRTHVKLVSTSPDETSYKIVRDITNN